MLDPRLASSRLHADADRLKAQVGLSWSKEAGGLARLGLRDGMSILEVGSGPGYFSELLLVGLPGSRLTAVELDPVMCGIAREHLGERFAGRCDVVESSILQLDVPSDTFDFAIARFVFQHLAAPDLALLEIGRLLKPGGTLAILDIDDEIGGMVLPRSEAFTVMGRKVRQVQAARAGDRNIGRKLWRLLAEAGYTELGLDTLVFHSDELGLQAFLPQYDPARYFPFVVSDGLTIDEFRNYQQAYAAFVASPEAYVLQLSLLASGKKPGRTRPAG